jgi:glycosyltransferase involved in cell wall biosynthesis
MNIFAYLADQNSKLGRSLGISRMSRVVVDALEANGSVDLSVVVSKSSITTESPTVKRILIPWSTRNHVMRILTDNLHPLFVCPRVRPDVWYFPKGFIPQIRAGCSPSVVTVHDTIIQYYQDHYPKWRMEIEYAYWAKMLQNSLTHATAIMTVSEHAKQQIQEFTQRHGLPDREVHVTYEPCLYEYLPQPENPAKADYVLHLGSREPHKRTEWLIRLWMRMTAKQNGSANLPKLHIIGNLPVHLDLLIKSCSQIVSLPFLEDQALVSQFTAAKALILPSEIEGFGLPALEGYYLGTPVCYVRGTSVEEVLSVATGKGGFSLEDPDSLFVALDEVMAMPHDEVRDCGLKLRETYAASKVAERMIKVFGHVANNGS